MQCVFFEGVFDHMDKEDPSIHSTEFLLRFPKLFWKCSSWQKKTVG